jgi:sugar O-acyltransferase (sialic acid O-acetyltransferase NeuD family)
LSTAQYDRNEQLIVNKAKRLVIVGDSAFAEIAYEYFTYDSPYEVGAFSVEAAYLKRQELFGLPVVPFEQLDKECPPSDYEVYVALTYRQLNRLRARLVGIAKAKGYRLASYVSSRAFIWRNVQLGEHCFIFEDNTVQPFVVVGNNVVMWSGNHIGHHSRIGDNCFIASHAVLSGCCTVGDSCFLGVNCTIANDIKIGRDCWIGPGVMIKKDVPDNLLFAGQGSEPSEVPARRFFRVRE